MLRSRLIGSVKSQEITSVLSVNDSDRILVAKKNGDIEVYSTDNDTNNNTTTLRNDNSSISNFKLFQTYSNLLRNLPNASNYDLNIQEMFHSEQLNTIFIKCKSLLVLLNSTNLHLYDKIYDKRGIKQVWIKTHYVKGDTHSKTITKNSTNDLTILVYSTTKSGKLRLLIWQGRIYKQMLEISLPKQSKDQSIKSMEFVPAGDALLFTMSSGVYLWNFKLMALETGAQSKQIKPSIPSSSTSWLLKIDKIFMKKYPDNVADAITSLKNLCTSEDITAISQGNVSMGIDNKSLRTTRDKSPSDRHGFWGSKKNKSHASSSQLTNESKDIRHIFNPRGDQAIILDGMTQNMFLVDIDSKLNKLIALEKKQFFQWNNNYDHIQYMSSDLLLLYNSQTIKFVDYNNGFTFLQENIDQGIKQVIKLPGICYLIWTLDDQLLLYTYQVDDDQYEPSTALNSRSTSTTNLSQAYHQPSDDTHSTDTEFSICGMYHDSSFYQLWRKVLFYRFFLKSPFSLQLCASEDPQESLDICAMKLRDLTVMWCLQMFAILQNSMNLLLYSNKNDKNKRKEADLSEYLNKIEEVVIQDIFNLFITMWAPPQLIIVKTFPKEISYLVEVISQQEHKCHEEIPHDIQGETYTINSSLIQKWVLPYLTDMRRHLRNLLIQQNTSGSNGTVTWSYENRHIPQDLDFFLLDRHGSIKIETMLSLLETVLFKTYIIYVPSMVGPLIRVDNMCDEQVVIEDLKSANMYADLIDFYFQKKRHREALEFLFSLIQADEKPGSDDKEIGLIIQYLKRLPNKNLSDLLYYLTKLIDIIHDVKIRDDILKSIFKSNSSINLRRDSLEIYQFIASIDKSMSLEYLEFIVTAVKTVDPKLHTQLVSTYVSHLTDKTMKNLELLLRDNSQYDPIEVLRVLQNASSEITLSSDDKAFLKLLQIYPLFRLEEHEKSIDILFTNLNNYAKASDYCNKVYLDNKKAGLKVLLYFLNLIIEKTYKIAEDKPETEQLFTFLEDYGDRLNITETLSLLPTYIPMKDIKRFLLYSIRKEKSIEQDTVLEKNILQVELANAKYSINHESSKLIEVNSEDTCRVCNRNFHSLNTESVYWFTIPNGKDTIVHYSCGKSLESRLSSNRQKISNVNTSMSLNELKRYMYPGNND